MLEEERVGSGVVAVKGVVVAVVDAVSALSNHFSWLIEFSVTRDRLVDSDEVTRIRIAGLSAAGGIDLIKRQSRA